MTNKGSADTECSKPVDHTSAALVAPPSSAGSVWTFGHLLNHAELQLSLTERYLMT